MESSLNDRILALSTSLSRNKADFSKSIGISTQSLASIINNDIDKRSTPSSEILKKILFAFPQVDPLWLVCGIGEMQKDLTESKQVDETELVKSLKRENEILIKNNDFLLKNQERLWVMVEGKKIEANEFPRVETKGKYFDLRPFIQSNEVKKEELGIVA